MMKIMIYHEQGVATLFDKQDLDKITEDKLVKDLSDIFKSNNIVAIRTFESIGIFRPSKINGIYITKVEETNKSEYIEQNNENDQNESTEDIITDLEE